MSRPRRTWSRGDEDADFGAAVPPPCVIEIHMSAGIDIASSFHPWPSDPSFEEAYRDPSSKAGHVRSCSDHLDPGPLTSFAAWTGSCSVDAQAAPRSPVVLAVRAIRWCAALLCRFRTGTARLDSRERYVDEATGASLCVVVENDPSHRPWRLWLLDRICSSKRPLGCRPSEWLLIVISRSGSPQPSSSPTSQFTGPALTTTAQLRLLSLISHLHLTHLPTNNAHYHHHRSYRDPIPLFGSLGLIFELDSSRHSF